MFKIISALLVVSTLAFTTTAQAASCKSVQAKITNKTQDVIDVLSIDYLAQGGAWRNQLTLKKSLQPDILWTQTLDLDEVGPGNTQVKVSFQNSKGASKSSTSAAFACKNNQPLAVDLK